MAENRVLKEKLGDRKMKLRDADRRRLAVLGKELGRKLLAKVATIAATDTILRWYREQVAKKYDGSRGPGRPRKAAEIVELVLQMVRENEGWGYTRVKGALKNLGYTWAGTQSSVSCRSMGSTRRQSEESECHGRHSSRHTWVRSSAWISSL
jgi:hypothetical protein